MRGSPSSMESAWAWICKRPKPSSKCLPVTRHSGVYPDESFRSMRHPTIEPFLDETSAVRGFLHLPASSNGDALVLTHSAGGNCQSPLLIALAEALAESGLTVLRCELPFRQMRPHRAA